MFFLLITVKIYISYSFLASSAPPVDTNSANGHDESKSDPISNEQEISFVGNPEAITTVLASVGHTLEGVQAELVLHPLRLAFETKNIKLVESALDCLHV